MSRRLRALAACAMLFAACKQRSYLGGQAIDASTCATSCMSMDAGVDASEVGPPERPDSRLPGEPADAATVAAFTASLEGLWHGVSRRLGMNENQISSRFELTFVANARGDGGRFDLRCFDDDLCAPFGAPGPGPEGGSYTIINLGERARATGKLAWEAPLFGDVAVPFWELRRDEQSFGPVVTFDLGNVNAGPGVSVARRVVLASGPWPDAGVTPVLDAGANEAGVSTEGGLAEAGALDAALAEAGALDAALRDAALTDAGSHDAGEP